MTASPFHVSKVIDLGGLSAKQLTAIMLFLSGPEGVRGSQAGAMRAAGYKPRSARQQASRLFTKANVRAFIEQHFLTMHVDAQRTTLETAAVSFSDPADLVGPDGQLLSLREMDPLVRRAIKSFDLDGDGKVVSVHLHNKVESLRLLASMQGLLRLGIDVQHKLPYDLIARVRDRAQNGQNGQQPQEVTDGQTDQGPIAGGGAGSTPAGLLPPGHPGLSRGDPDGGPAGNGAGGAGS